MCCGNNGFGGGCWWIIILVLILCCCCGNGNSWGGNNCGCNAAAADLQKALALVTRREGNAVCDQPDARRG